MSRNAILSAISVCTFLMACESDLESDQRSFKHIEPSVGAMPESTSESAFLIIGIDQTPDFIQMSAYRGAAELDFPQVTSRQKELRPTIEKICGELGLKQTVRSGSDGSEFLDYDLPSGATAITEVVKQVLVLVFNADAETVLNFEANGFDLPAV